MRKSSTRGHAKGQTDFDFSIPGDELEQHRIQLEHNLQHTDLSLHLSSALDDHRSVESIEYPRHNSGPNQFADFASFEHPSRDHFDPDSQLHAWSYRTADDEEGINPYGGETVSTAAHHASALTLSAGLGGRAGRRDISISGAEYDPDRPLHDIIGGFDSKVSVFDIDPLKSRHTGSGSIGFDPLVVDSTAELDRVLRSGHAITPRSRSVRLQSPHSSTSSSGSDGGVSDNGNPSTRPKLSEALRRVSFSPRRPRSAQSHRSSHLDSHHRYSQTPPQAIADLPHRGISSPLAQKAVDEDAPTPKPRIKRSTIPSYTSTQPEVRLQPPTPSTAGSKFTRMARGLTKEIETEQSRWDPGAGAGGSSTVPESHQSKPKSVSYEKNPFTDIVNQPDASIDLIRQPTPRRGSLRAPSGKLHLPDVTGLTSAVESPAKPGSQHYVYEGDSRPREAEVRLLSTLSDVQSKLHHLESENSISRRRVRELELELEACKKEVARERSRVLEREEVIVQQQKDVERVTAARKGKTKANAQTQYSREVDEKSLERYREVVEEKKALEALIISLRSHLTRLTSELSSHQQLLTELRTLRDSDNRALQDKSREVDRLREEVERLAGEVEVLRGVVEEGLKERRMAKEQLSQSHTEEEAPNESHSESEPDAEQDDDQDPEFQEHDLRTIESERNDFEPPSIHATRGSSNPTGLASSRQLIDDETELISAEIQERRSDRSGSILSQSLSRLQSSPRPLSPAPRSSGSREDSGSNLNRSSSPMTSVRGLPKHSNTTSLSRPSAPTPAHASRGDHSQSSRHQEPSTAETPFPQIRGDHLERLFFSAPEHNAKTCTVCYRRRRVDSSSELGAAPSWLPPRPERKFRAMVEDASTDDDEGFAEGSDEAEKNDSRVKSKGKQRQRVEFNEEHSPPKNPERESLPPQTVLARVLRELEDDFTHYKSIYVEFADQYKILDAASNVPKRNMLARHLREVIDILEQKGDQIASLYDLLSFKDKPVEQSVVPTKSRSTPVPTWSRGKS